VFAERVFFNYWRSGESSAIRASSAATGATYNVTCHVRSGRVTCTTVHGAVIRFSAAAVKRYSTAQANTYAHAHHLSRGSPTSPGATAPDPRRAPVSPPPPPPAQGDDFCSTHDCIPNYDNGNRSTDQCADGTYSQSGGIQGACSHHGGVR
jgi:hypothetical protein